MAVGFAYVAKCFTQKQLLCIPLPFRTGELRFVAPLYFLAFVWRRWPHHAVLVSGSARPRHARRPFWITFSSPPQAAQPGDDRRCRARDGGAGGDDGVGMHAQKGPIAYLLSQALHRGKVSDADAAAPATIAALADLPPKVFTYNFLICVHAVIETVLVLAGALVPLVMNMNLGATACKEELDQGNLLTNMAIGLVGETLVADGIFCVPAARRQRNAHCSSPRGGCGRARVDARLHPRRLRRLPAGVAGCGGRRRDAVRVAVRERADVWAEADAAVCSADPLD